MAMSVLPYILQYRELLHSCEVGDGLDIEQMLTLERLGSLLAKQATASASPMISAMVSTSKFDHNVQLNALGPDAAMCTQCPQLFPGTSIGLRLDDGSNDASYLFRAIVTCANYNTTTASWNLQLKFIGCPVVLSWGRGRGASPSAVVELEERLQAAA